MTKYLKETNPGVANALIDERDEVSAFEASISTL